MKKIIIYPVILIILVSLFAIPVSAADANNNEFFDFDDYAEYYPDDDGSVNVVVDIPEDWFRTLIYEKNYQGQNFVKTMNGFYIHDISVNGCTLLIRPFGSNLFSGGAVGQQVKDAHFIDLRYIPQKTEILFSFFVSMGYDNGFENGIVEDPEKFNGYRILYFVDENGKVVKRYNKVVKPEILDGNSDNPSFAYNCFIDLSDFAIPDNVVGLIPVFLLYDTLQGDYEINYIQFEEPTFHFSMTDLESDLMQNQRLKNLETKVKAAFEEQNKKIDEIANSKVDPTAPAGSDITDDLNKQEQELQGSAQDGLEQGKQSLTDALKILNGYLSAFHVVKFIFGEFASIPFFVGLITISLAIGLVATLLGMGLEFKSFSVAEEKRKNAANEKARRDHERAEYRRRMLERSKQK